MNARWPCSGGGNTCKATNPLERVIHRPGGDPPISRRQKHVVVSDGQPAPMFEVWLKGIQYGRMQRNEAALTELGATDL
jgi:hypothetical protein